MFAGEILELESIISCGIFTESFKQPLNVLHVNTRKVFQLYRNQILDLVTIHC